MKKAIGIIVALALILVVGIGAGYYFTHRGTSASIDQQEAARIAIEDAGFTESDVSVTKNKLDRDDGRSYYNIEFIASADNTRYDYEIDASSGAIISVDRETGSNSNTSQNTTTTQNDGTQANAQTDTQQTTQTGPQQAGEITADQAKQIALQHAGIAEADALYVDIEYDRDDGRTEWSVDFATQDSEYDYEIAAADGTIIKSERERH